MIPSIKPYCSRTFLSIFLLGIPYSVAPYLGTTTLQIWAKELGISNTYIGFFVWTSLPTVFMFLWTPLIDQIKIPYLSQKLGNRRSWLVLCQFLLIFLAWFLSTIVSASHVFWMWVVALFIAFFSSIQEVAIDVYRISVLPKNQDAVGESVLNMGYYIGTFSATAGALYLAHLYGWNNSYFFLILFIVMGLVVTLLSPEPDAQKIASSFENSITIPIKKLMGRKNAKILFLFVFLFQLGSILSNSMHNMFFLELHFTKFDIANVRTVSTLFTLLGSMISSIVIKNLTLSPTLRLSCFLNAFTPLFFAIFACIGHNLGVMYGVSIYAAFATGFLVTTFIVFISRQCDPDCLTEQYSFLSALWSLSFMIGGISGWVIDALNHRWNIFFFITFLFSFFWIPFLKILETSQDPTLEPNHFFLKFLYKVRV